MGTPRASYNRTILVCPNLLKKDKRFGEDEAGDKYNPIRSPHHDISHHNSGHSPTCGCLIDWEGHTVSIHVWDPDRLPDPTDPEWRLVREATCQKCGAKLVPSDGHQYPPTHI